MQMWWILAGLLLAIHGQRRIQSAYNAFGNGDSAV
jgi:hypothetical protein